MLICKQTTLTTTLLCIAVMLPVGRGQGFPGAAPQRPDGQRTPVDPAIPGYDPLPPMTGDLYVGGGFAHTLLEQWAAIFQRAHPNVHVHVAGWGSTSAFGELIEGVAKVTLLTREFMPFESDFLKEHMGMDQIGIPVATGGYSSVLPECIPSEVVLVNKDNPVKGITMPQLDAILSRTRKAGYKEDILHWGQLGVTGEWADKPIHVYLPRMPDGVPNFLKLNIMQDGEFKDTNMSLYDHPGVTAADPYALAIGNRGPGASPDRGHAPEARDPNAKIVPLAYTEAGPFTTGTFDDVRTRAYPLSRLIYLYLRVTPKSPPDPLAKEFVRVALSQEGQREVARTCMMPLPAKYVRSSHGTSCDNPRVVDDGSKGADDSIRPIYVPFHPHSTRPHACRCVRTPRSEIELNLRRTFWKKLRQDTPESAAWKSACQNRNTPAPLVLRW